MFKAFSAMLKGALNFEGRTSRKYHNLALLFSLILSSIVGYASKYLVLIIGDDENKFLIFAGILLLLQFVCDLVFFLPLRIRRLHDCNSNTTLYIVCNITCVVSAIVCAIFLYFEITTYVYILYALFGISYFGIIVYNMFALFVGSDPDASKYGPYFAEDCKNFSETSNNSEYKAAFSAKKIEVAHINTHLHTAMQTNTFSGIGEIATPSNNAQKSKKQSAFHSYVDMWKNTTNHSINVSRADFVKAILLSVISLICIVLSLLFVCWMIEEVASAYRTDPFWEYIVCFEYDDSLCTRIVSIYLRALFLSHYIVGKFYTARRLNCLGMNPWLAIAPLTVFVGFSKTRVQPSNTKKDYTFKDAFVTFFLSLVPFVPLYFAVLRKINDESQNTQNQ